MGLFERYILLAIEKNFNVSVSLYSKVRNKLVTNEQKMFQKQLANSALILLDFNCSISIEKRYFLQTTTEDNQLIQHSEKFNLFFKV